MCRELRVEGREIKLPSHGGVPSWLTRWLFLKKSTHIWEDLHLLTTFKMTSWNTVMVPRLHRLNLFDQNSKLNLWFKLLNEKDTNLRAGFRIVCFKHFPPYPCMALHCLWLKSKNNTCKSSFLCYFPKLIAAKIRSSTGSFPSISWTVSQRPTDCPSIKDWTSNLLRTCAGLEKQHFAWCMRLALSYKQEETLWACSHCAASHITKQFLSTFYSLQPPEPVWKDYILQSSDLQFIKSALNILSASVVCQVMLTFICSVQSE